MIDVSRDELLELIACIRREIALRQRVYPGLILRGKMTEHFADKEMERMRRVLDLLIALEELIQDDDKDDTGACDNCGAMDKFDCIDGLWLCVSCCTAR